MVQCLTHHPFHEPALSLLREHAPQRCQIGGRESEGLRWIVVAVDCWKRVYSWDIVLSPTEHMCRAKYILSHLSKTSILTQSSLPTTPLLLALYSPLNPHPHGHISNAPPRQPLHHHHRRHLPTTRIQRMATASPPDSSLPQNRAF